MMESEPAMPTASDAPNGIHMQHLQKALDKTTRKCVSSLKFSLLKRHFEPIYKKDPKTLQKLHEEASAQLSTNIKEELAVMFEEENIQDFMVKLDEIKAQADEMDENLVAWRPSGNPSEDIRAHVHPIHLQHLHQLQKVFEQLQSQNTLLRRTLKKEQDKLLHSCSAIQDHLQTWKKANCLTAEEEQELKTFMKDL
ncbi:hypothetical protein ACOMHN_001151 [Nucella lapillus]